MQNQFHAFRPLVFITGHQYDGTHSVSHRDSNPTQLQEIRTSQLRRFGPVLSGIDKTLQNGQLYVDTLGLPADEHDLAFHGGVDKAIR